MTTQTPRQMTVGEEIAHSVTHGVGCLLGVVGLVLLLEAASAGGSWLHVLAAGLYGATIVVLYGASTLFHALAPGRNKRIAQSMDHAAIFLLIAGTYTPFALVTLEGPWGYALFVAEWVLAAVGIVHEFSRGEGGRRFQLGLYVVMGWAIVVAVRPLLRAMPGEGLALLLAGGLFYTVGVGFYVWERRRWNHAIWHLFVLAGSICHFFAVYWFVMPS